MNKKTTKTAVAKALLILAASCSFTGCIDDSYDLSKDIDMTMGLGAEGLQLKLGNTEKIMLADILETDDNLKTDAQNQYYLVEQGTTQVNFHVDNVSVFIDNAKLTPESVVADYNSIAALLPGGTGSSLSIPANFSFKANGVTASDDYNAEVDNIADDITWIKNITPASGTKARFYLELIQTGMHFSFKDISNLKLQIPAYIKVTNPTNGNVAGNVISFSNRSNLNTTAIDLGEVTISDVAFAGESGKISGNALRLGDQTIAMTGNFSFVAPSAFTMSNGSSVTVRLTVYIGNRTATQSEISIASITGRFNPEINPNIENINVSDNLPDFLQDDEVVIKVSNPTLKLAANMTAVPVGLNFSADLTAVKSGQQLAATQLPATGTASIAGKDYSLLYFYQDAAAGPFDSYGIPSYSETHVVPSISSLIEKLPDYVSVNVGDGRIRVKDEDATIQLGHNYHTQFDYKLLVPFSFEQGLRVVYNDSIYDMNGDLKDYEADGVTVTADILNAIPLSLSVTAIPVDAAGRVIEGITISTAHVDAAQAATSYDNKAAIDAAAVTTPITLDLSLTDRALLRQLDRLRFRIEAEGVQDAATKATLSSLQYLIVKDMRLKLKGSITADFN